MKIFHQIRILNKEGMLLTSINSNKEKVPVGSFIGLAVMCLVLFITACGPLEDNDYPWLIVDENQDGDDTDGGKAEVTLKVMEGELLEGMKYMLNYQKHSYQYMRANSIDSYAGYMTVSQNNFIYGGPLPTTYTFPNPYLGGPMGASLKLFPQLYNAYMYAEQLGVPEWKAIAEIMYAYSMHEIIDIYGAVPFDDLRNLKENPPINYESAEKVYFKIFDELEEAIKVLKERAPTSYDLAKIEGVQGGLSQGKWQLWVKFANAIRLRMAMNMVKVKPAKAQEIAESAVNDEIGVLQYTDIAYTDENSGKQNHPLYDISAGWDDLRLGGSLENILKHFNNPLIGVWFTKNSSPIYSKEGNSTGFEVGADYFGIRQGVPMIDKSNKTQGYGMYSYFKVATFPRSLLKVSEVLFLRAEGALRGWNMGGDAKSLYEEGIKRSFDENGIGNQYEAYVAQDKLPVVDYVDPYDQANNIEGRVSIGVKWNDIDTKELKLEKIITQKYIANFGMGAEAWTTFRRTGYPRLFPVRINNWPGVDTELQLRRIPYIQTDNNAADIATSLIPALGGSNEGGQRIWWDVATEDYNNGKVVPRNF
ncbi:SusD/RagB family nutrient-binding outer membrane lipoprotein [Saccharicrinis sp. GN24d3]|uniref:SusD/RagB family nutrient-binding outer membrane lipoprotein n=1 Tax=Saccharicrinis sp. GN24d3 TaxID=3458416 RepID=UPI0040369104